MSAPKTEKTLEKKPERYNWTVFLKHLTLVSYCDASQVFRNVTTEYLGNHRAL